MIKQSKTTKAIKLQPDNAESYVKRGIAYLDAGKVEETISDYSKAIELNPDDKESYYHRGIAYGEKGEFQCAIEDLLE